MAAVVNGLSLPKLRAFGAIFFIFSDSSQGRRLHVVSLPSWDIFEQQPQSYRESVVPAR
jgi:transketolase